MGPSAAPRRRRRATADEVVTIYWRDIPAQVTANSGGTKGSWLLEPRFQTAIDRAAVVAGLTDADAYVRQWRRVAAPCSGDPDDAARAAAEAIQEQYDAQRLRALVDSGGLEPDSVPSPTPPKIESTP